MIRVLFFGPVAERIAVREMQIEYRAEMKLQDVIAQLQARHPEAFQLVSFIAVNNMQVGDRNLVLNDHDEIAFMAKYSGG